MTAASPEPPAPAPAAPRHKSAAENVKDTLESIVIAFILAFVFRAFIVEAFVIPTGSMAVTLYGDQLTNTCSTCGFEYPIGVTQTMVEHAVAGYSRTPIRLACPNCNALFDQLEPARIVRPDSGDRILVHKWPFDIGGERLGPERWDVTVFKDPRDGTTNFIKRLVGLPGEVVQIIDGDVYAVSVSELSPEILAAFDALRVAVYEHRRTGSTRVRTDIIDRYGQLNRQILPLMEIQRKLPNVTRAQEGLWFNVYDHNFLPNYQRPSAEHLPLRVGWRAVGADAGTAWNTSEREISFASQRDEPLAIRFSGKQIDDFYAYNNDGVAGRGPETRQLVGDLRLRFVWFPDSGNGGIRMSMNRDQEDFTAELRSDGRVRIEGHQPGIGLPGDRQLIGEARLPAFSAGRAVEVEFINLDYRVALFIGGREVLASTPEQYSPRLDKLIRFTETALRENEAAVDLRASEVRIAGWNMSFRLRHVAIERDVYYRSQRQIAEPPVVGVEGNSYVNWPGWGTAGCPILLRPGDPDLPGPEGGEYYMLGDNSPASKDSRLWWEIGPHLRHLEDEYQLGTVPHDQLIGKAFFVYWPAGYRPAWAPGIGLIPNFGQMRWIR